MVKFFNDQTGLTLIEIMIVVIIIGFLAAFVGPDLFNRVSETKITVAKNQIAIFEVALDNYRLDNGQYPTTRQGLRALIEEPTVAPLPNNWSGPYLEKKELPLDPWGNPYHYECPGNNNTHKYDLWSWGRDNRKGGTGEDADVTNW